MSYLGIDIGTSSVRACIASETDFYTHTIPITRLTSPENPRYITQSSTETWLAIKNSIGHVTSAANNPIIKAIGIDATCSMVVTKNGKMHACDFNQQNSDQNIILWMDSRAHAEADQLNQILPKSATASVGGRFIAEMGLPKLKWLQDDIEAWELHDWVAAKFAGITNLTNLTNSPNLNSDQGCKNFGDGIALDGNIKGWTSEILALANIERKVIQGLVVPLGTTIGTVGTEIASEFPSLSNAVIKQGCIDCYAGWIATKSMINLNPRNKLFMVAGTSTCFILPVDSNHPNQPAINGVWGPYGLLLQDTTVYQTGQTASGKLYEDLFNQYRIEPEFDTLELETSRLEVQFNTLITEILRRYFFYGDMYGNRSPHNSSQFGGMMLDGRNGSDPQYGLPSIFEHSSIAMILQYNLIMEFLCLQTKDLIDRMNCSVDTIIISGSQGKNGRFLQLLADTTQCSVLSPRNANSTSVCYGAAIIANGALPIGSKVDQDALVQITPQTPSSPVLKVKQALFNRLSQAQKDFHDALNQYVAQ